MRVLFLTHRLPYAANRGDRVRALHMLQVLSRRADVDLVSLVHSPEEAEHADDLRPALASVTVARTGRIRGYRRALAGLATRRPFTHALLDARDLGHAIRQRVAEHPPDVVLAYCSGMARLALEPPLDEFPLILDMVDVDSEKWRALGATSRPPARWLYASEARRLATFEAVASARAQAVLVVNERERNAVLALAPTANVQVMPNGVALDHLRPISPPSEELRVSFCGVMNYRPNEEAVLWFARSVWPAVRSRYPDARFVVIGSDPTAALRRAAADDATIELTGAVADVRPHLWRAAVSVAPLLVARGVQNKVLEAVAAGLPCVVTPAVQDGLPPQVSSACLLASDPSAFSAAVLDLLGRSATERRAMAARANLSELSWDRRLDALAEIVSRAARSRGRHVPLAPESQLRGALT